MTDRIPRLFTTHNRHPAHMHPEFPLNHSIVHLNHAGVGPWPRRTTEVVRSFAEENTEWGSFHYPEWLQAENHLRDQCRRLVNAEANRCIALVKNTSEALSFVAYGIDWRTGDEVVCPAEEFPSNRVVWQSLAPRFGVETRLVELDMQKDPEQALLDACGPRTRLLATSTVQYASGLRMDLERLGSACRKRGIAFCVDAIQSLGALPFDGQACQADFVAADGHKWLLAPEGIGLFYCRSEWIERLMLNQYGWHMLEHRGDFDRLDWSPAKDARRFECGSPNTLGIRALSASLSLLLDTGMDEVERRITHNIRHLQAGIDDLPADTVTPRDPARRAGILNFRPRGKDIQEVYQGLMQEKILCAPRAGGIRFSPHFYTDEPALIRALAVLGRLLA